MNTHGEPLHETVLDSRTERVATTYAAALLNAAEEKNLTEAVLGQLHGLVGEVFAADPNFETFLASSAIRREQKEQALRSAFDGKSDPLLLDFLLVVNRHERLDLLRAITASYRRLFDEKARRMGVKVRSAVPLSDEQQERLRHELRESFGKEPVLDARTDPELLGGLVVQVGDWVYDGSVRARLETVRQQLLTRSEHEIQHGRDRFRS